MTLDLGLMALFLAVVVGTFFSFGRNNHLIRQTHKQHGEKDEKRHEKEWEILTRWYPLGQYGQLLSGLIIFTLVGLHPVVHIIFTVWQVRYVNKHLIIFCANTIHLSEKKRYLHKKKTAAPDEEEAAEALLEKATRDARPHYMRFAWISSVLALIFIALRFFVFV